MSKGLDALKKIKTSFTTNCLWAQESCNTIEKELKDFEWLKSKINIDFFYQLSSEDREKLAEILGVKL